MMALRKISIAAAFSAILLPMTGWAQAQNQAVQQGQQFSAEDAILDTSVLFAIGAHQAEQTLRSAFGWATFQEGLVDGVYFRFDPDGYARFAPNPRLDQDAFEVVCAPRSRVCAAKKDELEVGLTPRNEIQITIAGIRENDVVSVTDGQTELPLPSRIFQPLDVRLETLLAAGGDLVVRRDGNEFRRIALMGFNAVSTYLRWVASGQDSSVFPRGWPVPSDPARLANNGAQPGWTQPQQPAQPQAPNYQQIAQQRQQTASQTPQPAVATQPGQPVAAAQQAPASAQQAPVPQAAADPPQPQDGNVAASITQLQAQLEELSKLMAQNGGTATQAQPTMQPQVGQPQMHPQAAQPMIHPQTGQPILNPQTGQPMLHPTGPVTANLPQQGYSHGNPAYPGYPQPQPQGQWPTHGGTPQDWSIYRDLIAAQRAANQQRYPSQQMPVQAAPAPQYPPQNPAVQGGPQPAWQDPAVTQPASQVPQQNAPQPNSTEQRLEALFARLNEIEAQGRAPNTPVAQQQLEEMTGGKTKKPAAAEHAHMQEPAGRQVLQPGAADGGTPYGPVSPMDARIERLEEMLARLLEERQRQPSDDRVDLGAGVYIERELVEEIIAELDGEIGIGALEPIAEPEQQVLTEKSESKVKSPASAASPQDEYKTLQDYLSTIVSKENPPAN